MLTPAAVRTGARVAGVAGVGLAAGAAEGEGVAGDGVGLTAAIALTGVDTGGVTAGGT